MKITREIIEKSPKKYFLKGKKKQADVFLIEVEGKKIIIKDYYPKKGLVKKYGKYIIKREYLSYKKLQKFQFVPRVYCMPDKYSLAIEFIEGKTFGEVEKKEEYCFAVKELQKCLVELHRNNIFHLDLRKRGNIIIKDKKVYLIDFASMIFLKPYSPLMIFKPIFKYADTSSIVKWKSFICPSQLTQEDLKKLKKFEFLRMLWIFNKPRIPGKK